MLSRSARRLAVGIVAGFLLSFGAPGMIRQALAACTSPIMTFVAHEDDDLLLLSPDLLHAVQSAPLGACARVVFLTAGDAGAGQGYATSRENGVRAAYSQMAGVANAWTQTDAGISGHPIPLFTLNGSPNVSLLFVRLPDGNVDGTGFSAQGNQSLQKLWNGVIGTIQPIDGTPIYTKASLISTLTALMGSFQPAQIRTLDFVGAFGDGDHSDHHAAAFFTRSAHQLYGTPHTLTGYQGYPSANLPANVTGTDLVGKQNAFFTYGAFDGNTCSSIASCMGTTYEQMLQRQYTAGSETGGSGGGGGGVTNVAGLAAASASSQNISSGQSASKAVDGVVDGYPGDYTREWATAGGGAGSFLQLTWATPVTLTRVVLYDRPNANDQVLSGRLTFSDGTTLNVGTLANNGTGSSITFPAKATTTLRFTVLTVSAKTVNIGLAELEAFGSTGGQPGNQAPVADAGIDTTVPVGADVQLDGFDSFDLDGNPITFAWTQTGGPAVTLSGASSATPTFTAPAAPATLTFQLIVNDGIVNSAPSTVVVTVAPPEINSAPSASVTASSQSTGTSQAASKAIDGEADGYPSDYTKEWATVGGGAGSFLQLTWATPVTLTRVVLYDRPNVDDQILAGTLTFSDGTTLSVGTLPNDGSPLAITFPARDTTSLRLTITSVSGSTVNVGLSEIEAWGPP